MRCLQFLSHAFLILAALASFPTASCAAYVGSASVASPNSSIQSAAMQILGNGGGNGVFIYKGGGNAVDAVVAAALSACVNSAGLKPKLKGRGDLHLSPPFRASLIITAALNILSAPGPRNQSALGS